MKRKHRIVVELTFDKPVTAKDAARFVDRIVEQPDAKVAYEERARTGAEATHYAVKQGDRVIAAERARGRGEPAGPGTCADKLQSLSQCGSVEELKAWIRDNLLEDE